MNLQLSSPHRIGGFPSLQTEPVVTRSKSLSVFPMPVPVLAAFSAVPVLAAFSAVPEVAAFLEPVTVPVLAAFSDAQVVAAAVPEVVAFSEPQVVAEVTCLLAARCLRSKDH